MHFAIQLRVELHTGGSLVDEPVHLPVCPEGATLLRPPLFSAILTAFLAQEPVEEAVEGPEMDGLEGFLGVAPEKRTMPTPQLVNANQVVEMRSSGSRTDSTALLFHRGARHSPGYSLVHRTRLR